MQINNALRILIKRRNIEISRLEHATSNWDLLPLIIIAPSTTYILNIPMYVTVLSGAYSGRT